MSYTNLNSAKLALGIALSNTVYDGQISQFISQAQDAITQKIGRDLTYKTATEYLKGNGQQYLPLTQRPVTLIQQTCTLNSTATVAVGDGSKLAVGMPVCGTNPTPVNNPSAPAIVPGTTIVSISGNTVTLSQAANVSGSQTLFFGMQVWVDELAYWGQASGSFGTLNALTPGVDFGLDVDQADGTSRSGLIYNINGWWPTIYNYTPGIITPVMGPFNGNIKVTYTSGYINVPASLQLAANLLVAKIRQVSGFGQALAGESVKDYSYSLANPSDTIGLFTPEISSLLASFINVAV